MCINFEESAENALGVGQVRAGELGTGEIRSADLFIDKLLSMLCQVNFIFKELGWKEDTFALGQLHPVCGSTY